MKKKWKFVKSCLENKEQKYQSKRTKTSKLTPTLSISKKQKLQHKKLEKTRDFKE